MSLFSRKKDYMVVWSYGFGDRSVDLIRAKSASKAWEKLKKRHCLASLISIKEVQSDEFMD